MSIKFNGAYAREYKPRNKSTKLDKIWNVASGSERDNNPRFEVLVIRPTLNMDDIYGEPSGYNISMFTTTDLFDTIDKISPYGSRDDYDNVRVGKRKISFENKYASYSGEEEQNVLRLNVKAKNGYEAVELFRYIPKV